MDEETRRWYHDTTESHRADDRTNQATRDADRMAAAVGDMRQALEQMSSELAASERSRKRSDKVTTFLAVVTAVLALATVADIVTLFVRG